MPDDVKFPALLAALRAALGPPRPDDELTVDERRARHARTGKECGDCFEPFDKGTRHAVQCRVMLRALFGWYRTTTIRMSVCQSCFDKRMENPGRIRWACEGCGKSILVEYDFAKWDATKRPPRRAKHAPIFVCGDECYERARLKRNNDRRRRLRKPDPASRQHQCVVCGATFEGRRDAVTCSNACRQRRHQLQR